MVFAERADGRKDLRLRKQKSHVFGGVQGQEPVVFLILVLLRRIALQVDVVIFYGVPTRALLFVVQALESILEEVLQVRDLRIDWRVVGIDEGEGEYSILAEPSS